jgi:hypothetical protein
MEAINLCDGQTHAAITIQRRDSGRSGYFLCSAVFYTRYFCAPRAKTDGVTSIGTTSEKKTNSFFILILLHTFCVQIETSFSIS